MQRLRRVGRVGSVLAPVHKQWVRRCTRNHPSRERFFGRRVDRVIVGAEPPRAVSLARVQTVFRRVPAILKDGSHAIFVAL